MLQLYSMHLQIHLLLRSTKPSSDADKHQQGAPCASGHGATSPLAMLPQRPRATAATRCSPTLQGHSSLHRRRAITASHNSSECHHHTLAPQPCVPPRERACCRSSAPPPPHATVPHAVCSLAHHHSPLCCHCPMRHRSSTPLPQPREGLRERIGAAGKVVLRERTR